MTTLDSSVVDANDTPTSPIVDAEFQALVPALHADELKLLEQSLNDDGCRDALVVWKETNILLDGHNRLAICKRLGIAFTTTTLSFDSRNDALLWVIENQLGRRNLSDIDRVKLARHLEELLKTEAAKNRGQRTDLVPSLAPGSKRGRTRDRAAAAAGVSHGNYDKAKKVLDDGVPELQQAVRDRDASLHAAVEIAKLPAEEQRDVVSSGVIKATADKLRNRRTKNTGNTEWGTPRPYIEAAREVLGTIDVDPATHANAQARIKATTFYTREDDGLSKVWTGNVFLNPPTAKTLIARFVKKLVDEYVAGNVKAAVLLVSNETDAGWFQTAAAHATHICFPRGRLTFLRPNGDKSRNDPMQGQAVLFLGSDGAKFIEVFSKLGFVASPACAAPLEV